MEKKSTKDDPALKANIRDKSEVIGQIDFLKLDICIRFISKIKIESQICNTERKERPTQKPFWNSSGYTSKSTREIGLDAKKKWRMS